MIEGVLSKDIDIWWKYVDKYISSALEYGVGEYTSQDIKELCKKKEMQLWVKLDKGVEGAFITQILNYPQMNILLVLVLSGKNFKSWRNETDELLQGFGKENNCKYIELFGRKGWGNYLKDINYKEQVRVYSKEIV
jgi:hypothetical protein